MNVLSTTNAKKERVKTSTALSNDNTTALFLQTWRRSSASHISACHRQGAQLQVSIIVVVSEDQGWPRRSIVKLIKFGWQDAPRFSQCSGSDVEYDPSSEDRRKAYLKPNIPHRSEHVASEGHISVRCKHAVEILFHNEWASLFGFRLCATALTGIWTSVM